MFRKLTIHALIVAVALMADMSTVRGDSLLLKSGGRVEGRIRRRPGPDATGDEATFVVQVREGIYVRIAARQVGRVIETSQDEREYQRLLPKMPDTAAGHATMAQWCHDHGLPDQKDLHWEHVLQHDGDHAEARRVLGYSRIRGRWTRAEDFMKAQGYVRYKGRWRLPRAVAMEQRRQETEVAEKGWRHDIRMWRGWLEGRRSGEAMERLQAIDDPLAAPGLAELLARESDASVRELYVDLLARLATPSAVSALIRSAIHDDDVEVRLRSVDYIREMVPDRAVIAWSATLRSRDNRLINRAAVALERLGRSEAVRPLIGALVTQHTTVVQPSAGIRPSFGSSADGSSSFGGLSAGGGPRKVKRNLQNKSVLKALVTLTDQNHRYSESDWNNWYIQQRSVPDNVNLRRD